MIAGIEAFKRRSAQLSPLSPVVPAVPATRKPNRDGLSPLSPPENTIPANESAKTTYRVSLNQANDSDEAPADWWATFREKIDQCDRLIHQLCDLRGDDEARRADLLATRKRAAPVHLDGDIEYLEKQIASRTPAPITQSRGRCIECESFARVGTGERCAHPDRSPAGEPARADCLPAHQCERFIHWRQP
jgi:hypothetical protein